MSNMEIAMQMENINFNRKAVDAKMEARLKKVDPIALGMKTITVDLTTLTGDLRRLVDQAKKLEVLCQDKQKKEAYLKECQKKLAQEKRAACWSRFKWRIIIALVVLLIIGGVLGMIFGLFT